MFVFGNPLLINGFSVAAFFAIVAYQRVYIPQNIVAGL
jgi:CBS domain containing-hemolysin-like protein